MNAEIDRLCIDLLDAVGRRSIVEAMACELCGRYGERCFVKKIRISLQDDRPIAACQICRGSLTRMKVIYLPQMPDYVTEAYWLANTLIRVARRRAAQPLWKGRT